MNRVMDYLKKHAVEFSYISLMSAKGKEPFYEKYGFVKRPTDNLGHGMQFYL